MYLLLNESIHLCPFFHKYIVQTVNGMYMTQSNFHQLLLYDQDLVRVETFPYIRTHFFKHRY